ncbi:MAG: hypothetical protein ACOYXW_01825 [Actinomycetota bacterium]
MARSRSLLERFRPAGTPGAAAKPGVPADRVAELSAELEPVLALLADSVDEASSIRAAARRDAERIRREAAERAQALVAQARRDAEAERAEAAARMAERAEAESAQAVTAAEDEAAAVRRRGAERMSEYVDRVLAELRHDIEKVVSTGSKGPGL